MHAFPNKPLDVACLLLGLTLSFAALPSVSAKDSPYSRSTVVVCNKNFPNSERIARQYLTQRGVPSSNLITLACSEAEEISRVEYEETIATPLRQKFIENKWWEVEESANGKKRVTSSKIHVLVLIHGVPLKIRDTGDMAKKPNSDAASVDSELVLLGNYEDRFSSWTPNPYFRKTEAFGDAGLPQMLLVGRVDGPDVPSVTRLINDASDIERTGLWGRAFVDLAQKTSGGYEEGENWLKKIVSQCHTDGIPVVVDHNAATFPNHYPMKDAALYFGWYTRNANGPLNHPDFQFKKGAIACHIDSYSALTVRSKTEKWVGPLVAKGACGVVGNVYEPFLSYTTNLDAFLKYLLDGYTLVEAAYKATPSLSWMTVVVGDPLYRPYDGFRTYEPQFFRSDDDLHYKTYHVAVKRWGLENKGRQLPDKLERATSRHKTGFYYECLANRERYANGLNRAVRLLDQAKQRYFDPIDRFRAELQIVAIERQRKNKSRAEELLKRMRNDDDYQSVKNMDVITALLNQIDPPGPSGS